MKNIVFICDSGRVEWASFDKDDDVYATIAKDIFRRIPDYDKEVIILNKIHLQDGYTIKDVLNKFFISGDGDENDGIYIANAGTIEVKDKKSYTFDELLAQRNEENRILNELGFVNVKWSNSMFESYTMTDSCIYDKGVGHDFIEEYSKDHEENKYLKLIDRVYKLDDK